MRLLRFLSFGRWRRGDSAPIREDEAYAHSYGERSGEIVSVTRMPEPAPQPAPAPEPAPELEITPEPERDAEPEPVANGTSGLTDALLRHAFAAKLDARGKAHT
jgi:hypothetical protein